MHQWATWSLQLTQACMYLKPAHHEEHAVYSHLLSGDYRERTNRALKQRVRAGENTQTSLIPANLQMATTVVCVY